LSAATISRRQRTPPIGPRSWLRYNASSPKATKRWSATPATDAISRRSAIDHFAIDLDKVEEDKKFDGIFVLRTNTGLNPLQAMLCYKQLWTVEHTLQTR
jgi:hypothetical protein